MVYFFPPELPGDCGLIHRKPKYVTEYLGKKLYVTSGVQGVTAISKIFFFFLFLRILFSDILINSCEKEIMIREVVTCPE